MKTSTYFLMISAILTLATPSWGDEAGRTLNCPEKPQNEAKSRKLAGSLFTEAEASFDNGLYLTALESFLCSMVMVEHPNTVINIEKTLEKLPDKRAAVVRLREYANNLPDGELTPKITTLADELEKDFVKEAPPEVVCPEPTPPEVTCPPPSDCAEEIKEVARSHRILSITGWVDVSIGAVAFVSAIVLQGVAGAHRNKAENATNYQAFLDSKDKNKSFQIAATSLFITSALVAGTGLAHLLLVSEREKRAAPTDGTAKENAPKDDKKQENKPKVSLVPGPTWFGIEGTF